MIKKILLLSLIGVLAQGKNIDDFISEYEKNSYTTKINEYNLKSFDIKERTYRKGDWNEISLTSDNNYQATGNNDGVTIDNTIKYGLFYYQNAYNFKSSEVTRNKIGISKTLNDFWGYSDSAHNLRTNEISRNIQKITNETTKNSEIRNLIDLYKNYKNKEKEMEQEKLSVEDYKKDYNIQQRKYQVGTGSKYDFELARTEYENSKLTYDNLERELKILEQQFITYNVTVPDDKKMDDLKKDELKNEDFYQLRLSEAENIKLNQKLNDENLKKEKFDYKYPKFTADAGYDFEEKSTVVGLGITKTWKQNNDTIDDLKNTAERLKWEYAQKEAELVSNVGQEMLNYTTYQTNELKAENTMNIREQEYNIYAKKYELGTDTYSNLVEKRNDYRKAVIDYETAKNELAAFTKKIRYYK